MALIKCTECGKEISDKAKLCPLCGAPTAFAKNQSEKKKEFAISTLPYIALVILIGVIGYTSTRPPCLRSAKERLKYPDTMEFVGYERNSKILEISAKTGFGVRKRIKFKCVGSFAMRQDLF
tara:strand:- start:141 stop:506 length:366 start_codon:yes stop_codon:yes gene_type:complete